MANSSAKNDFSEREFPMTSRDFDQIRNLAYSLTGIKLSEHKKNMIYGRLARRLRFLDIATFEGYCDLLTKDNSPEHGEFINSITTNLTSFFRENHHFDYLVNQALPQLQKTNGGHKKIRIWSAGCSTGEEPYSISMSVKLLHSLTNWDVKILATDLDSNVIEKASSGIYAEERVESVEKKYHKFYSRHKTDGTVLVNEKARELIRFNQLNLLENWPMRGTFDIIFCRNVVIYFDVETQKNLFERYAEIMNPNGILFIGHSESLHNISNRFTAIGRTIYRRVR